MTEYDIPSSEVSYRHRYFCSNLAFEEGVEMDTSTEQDTKWTWREARIYAQKRADETGKRMIVFEAYKRVYAMLLEEWHFVEPGTTMVQTFVPKKEKP